MFVEVIFCLLLHVVPILLFIHACKKAWGNWGCDRYNRHDKRSKLPAWILSHLRDAHLNLSTDMSLYIAREFLRRMAQPYDKTGAGARMTLLCQADLEKMNT
jgi:hypothetical protein